MKKVSVIISHEYSIRVRSRWFILSTLLGPLVMVLFIALPVAATLLMGDGIEGKIAVVDHSAFSVGNGMVMGDTGKYVEAAGRTIVDLADAVKSEEFQAYVVIPDDILGKGVVKVYSRGGTGLTFEEGIEDDLRPIITKARLNLNGTDLSVIDLVEQGIDIESLKLTETGVEKDGSTVSAAIGYGAGFAIYILIFLYGTLVMRGVIDEKANRIVEVLASSAKPFEIMMGKVIGIGMVGLTQVLAWLVLGGLVLGVLSATLGGADSLEVLKQAQNMQGANPMAMGQSGIPVGGITIPDISVPTILLFIFYFLGGFFIYATLFAAVGSAVDQESDANSLTLPISMPIILTVMFIGNVVSSPNSTTSVVLSLIPLFTPILMTVRVAATDVPAWQIASSIVLTLAAFMAAIWVASRIYRIGILSYGKKPTLMEIARWVTMNR